jgi:RNA polymerase sigma factor (sigma-70 family)
MPVESQDAVSETLHKLPRSQRTVLALRYLEDLSEQQIADLLGYSLGGVKSQLSRGPGHIAAIHRSSGGGRQ